MTAQKHLNSDTEDIEDVLKKIEKSYDIRFVSNELAHVRTFGELCECIISKIKQQDTDDCTTQQAFYKLRDAIAVTKQLDKSFIKTNTTLSSVFPRHRRRKQIAEVEKKLGFKLHTLQPKYYILSGLMILGLVSFIGLFFYGALAFSELILSILFIYLVIKTGKEFNEKTIGELAEKIIQESYLKSRRNPATVNKREIVNKIEQLFIHELGLGNDLREIKPDTIIVERG